LLEPAALSTLTAVAAATFDAFGVFASTGSEKTPSTNCERNSREQCITRYRGAGAPSTVWPGLYHME
jgi:hypothetical protein